MSSTAEPEFGQSQETEQDGDKKPRQRSTIEFPYIGLEDCAQIARTIHGVGGTAAEWDQVAATLDQAPAGGAFRQKMLAARTYGLINYKGQDVELTPAGQRIIDPASERHERVAAFLNVPLFRKAFEEWKNIQLPPAAAIQRQMHGWGVAPKQADKARQVFMRSATYAGFFELQPDKLVKPNTKSNAADGDASPPGDVKHSSGDGGGQGGGDEPPPPLHPFVSGLLAELPTAHSEWPPERRAKWLQTASSIFDMIYSDTGGSAGEVTVEFRPTGSASSGANDPDPF